MSGRNPFVSDKSPIDSMVFSGLYTSVSQTRSRVDTGPRSQTHTTLPYHEMQSPVRSFSWREQSVTSPLPQTSTPISGMRLRSDSRIPYEPEFQITPETGRRTSDRHLSEEFHQMQVRFAEDLGADSIADKRSKSRSRTKSSFGYSGLSQLEEKDPNDWPLTEIEREELKAIGFLFTGEDRGEMIGEGAFGQIWRCEKMMSNGEIEELACKKVALKFYKIENKTLERAQELLINEMKAHQLAKHPNIVRTEYVHHIYDRKSVYPHPITTLIFMELCDGDLAQLLRSRRPMKEPIAVKWFHQMVQALSFLHMIHVAHRDIKPANILYKIGPNGGYCFKFTDFGLVKIFENRDVQITPVSPKSKTYLGTEDYMAPEIQNKTLEDEYDPFKADVFSLGVCLLQTMKTMFKSLVNKFKNNEVQNIERRVKGMSNELKDLLLKMLIFDPKLRITIEQVCDHSWLKKSEYNPGFIDLDQ